MGSMIEKLSTDIAAPCESCPNPNVLLGVVSTVIRFVVATKLVDAVEEAKNDDAVAALEAMKGFDDVIAADTVD